MKNIKYTGKMYSAISVELKTVKVGYICGRAKRPLRSKVGCGTQYGWGTYYGCGAQYGCGAKYGSAGIPVLIQL